MVRLSPILLVLLLWTGCTTYVQAPSTIGRVFDAGTGKPIRGARVTRPPMNPDFLNLPQGLPETTVKTDRFGRFRMPGARGSFFLFQLHSTHETFTITYRVEADGYRAMKVTGFASSNTLWRVELEHIKLTRQ